MTNGGTVADGAVTDRTTAALIQAVYALFQADKAENSLFLTEIGGKVFRENITGKKVFEKAESAGAKTIYRIHYDGMFVEEAEIAVTEYSRTDDSGHKWRAHTYKIPPYLTQAIIGLIPVCSYSDPKCTTRITIPKKYHTKFVDV